MNKNIKYICKTILGLGLMALIGYLCTIDTDFAWLLLALVFLSI